MVDEKIKKPKVGKPIKELKKDYAILDKIATKAEIKTNKTDIGGTFYVFDLRSDDGELLAHNRYVYKNSEEQLFDELTDEEELLLNPIVEEAVIDGE